MESIRGLKGAAEPKFNLSSVWSKSCAFSHFFLLFPPVFGLSIFPAASLLPHFPEHEPVPKGGSVIQQK